jgi:hypothetical protein
MTAATKAGKTIDFAFGGGITIKVSPDTLVITDKKQCKLMIKDAPRATGGILGDACVSCPETPFR